MSGDDRRAPSPAGTDATALVIRPIASVDNAAVAAVIRAVMPEFGAGGAGFAINDPEVQWMHRAYGAARHAYFVVEYEGIVLGGAGVAPLAGAEGTVCELRKMYFLPQARGLGMGTAMMARCVDAARSFGFQQCYLETLHGMDAAMRLYERSGFRRLAAPMGETGHGGCNRFYLLDL